ncbi:GNAT family N-acetyltransferase [Streptomyces sp. NPDC058525]|uniref:GNAT family N-acetyltransferase n=1 Tax=Streptomyces sp. NPDC058525 TaxID=3346538 RepID=UPI003663DB60
MAWSTGGHARIGGAVRRVSGAELLRHADGVARVYADAFGTGPWSQDRAAAARYAERLAADVARPGFVAALALDGDAVRGFATGRRTPGVFPSGGCHPQVSAGLGAERTKLWLCGAREVDELAVHGPARGRGLGAALLDAVSADAPDGRCWLLTSVRAEAAMSFYRRLGWAQATHPAPGGAGYAAFLGPRHPARTAVPLPL